MELLIADNKTLGEIKKSFSEHFSHLKIEFYNQPHKEGEGSPERFQLEDDVTIGEARKSNTSGQLSIHGNLKTSTLEQKFKEVYGLNVQVFRKSNKLWLQTTSTDEWTLAHQDEVGRNHDR